MLYTIKIEHASPRITPRTVTRQRWDTALLAAKDMAHYALYGISLRRNNAIEHRVMGQLDNGLASTGTMTVSFGEYTLTIERTDTYKRKSRAKP